MSAARLRYRTLEFDKFDIHICSLRDQNEYSDDFGEAAALGISSAQWSLFGVIWASGEVLAHHMQDFNIEGKRILEVGCGIGLSSAVLNARLADITATDYHPEAGKFLAANVKLNNGKAIPFLRTGWADLNDDLGSFDLIIGSDLLYERGHISLLSEFIDRHANPQCEVILVDPGRGNHAPFSKKMTGLGYSHAQHQPKDCSYLNRPFSGQILTYKKCGFKP